LFSKKIQVCVLGEQNEGSQEVAARDVELKRRAKKTQGQMDKSFIREHQPREILFVFDHSKSEACDSFFVFASQTHGRFSTAPILHCKCIVDFTWTD
jgi:hypothetical protein